MVVDRVKHILMVLDGTNERFNLNGYGLYTVISGRQLNSYKTAVNH